MPEAVKEIKFRTTVDNKIALDSFDQIGESVKKLNPELSKIAVTTKGELTPALQNVSRRDLGLFANQLLYTGGAVGRIQIQLSQLATGLATGGMIGAGFAAGAAVISLITSGFEEANKKAEELKKTVEGLIRLKFKEGFFDVDPQKIPQAIELLKKKLENLESPLNRLSGLQGKVWGSGQREALKDAIAQLNK